MTSRKMTTVARPHTSSRESGQAMVESAITLPMVVFLILGTLQLFMMMQARIMAEYAAYRATRAGSLNHGNCEAMNHAAIATLLPTFAQVDTPAKLGSEFRKRMDNKFDSTGLTNGEDISGEAVVWIFRERPIGSDWSGPEHEDFDYSWEPMALDVRLVFWFPLRIPFADWVITRMLLANYGMQDLSGVIDPLSPAHTADWPRGIGFDPGTSNMGAYAHAQVVSKFQGLATTGKYLFPIEATASMRMMTPARRSNWVTQNCPPTPN